MSYNVENLFDCEHDSLKNDYDFLDGGFYHWTTRKYRTKLHHIAEVISAIGADTTSTSISTSISTSTSTSTSTSPFPPSHSPSASPSLSPSQESLPKISSWQAPAIVGLLEVENARCLQDLLRFHLPRSRFPYQIIHFESPDERGVDVAMLYDSTRFQLLRSFPIPVRLSSSERPTRDILYAQFAKRERHEPSVHVFLCHFPSQLGGAAATAAKRDSAFATLKQRVDSILLVDSASFILAMGDFNTSPAERLLPLCNLMLRPVCKSKLVDGTHQWHGQWTCLDQIFASTSIVQAWQDAHPQHPICASVFSPLWLLEQDNKYLGFRPFRTFSGPKYAGGYSDHLPVYIDINL